MARGTITPTAIDRDGVTSPTPTTSDATNDHIVINNDGRVLLEIISSDAGAQTVEVVPSSSFSADGLTVNNLSIAVAAGATVVAGPFRVSTFRQTEGSVLYLNPSVSTNLKIRAFSLPAP